MRWYYTFASLTPSKFSQAPPEPPSSLQGGRVTHPIQSRMSGLEEGGVAGRCPQGLPPSNTFAFAGQAFCVIVVLLRHPSPSPVHGQKENQYSQSHRSHDKAPSTNNHRLPSNQLRRGSVGPLNSQRLAATLNPAWQGRRMRKISPTGVRPRCSGFPCLRFVAPLEGPGSRVVKE